MEPVEDQCPEGGSRFARLHNPLPKSHHLEIGRLKVRAHQHGRDGCFRRLYQDGAVEVARSGKHWRATPRAHDEANGPAVRPHPERVERGADKASFFPGRLSSATPFARTSGKYGTPKAGLDVVGVATGG